MYLYNTCEASNYIRCCCHCEELEPLKQAMQQESRNMLEAIPDASCSPVPSSFKLRSGDHMSTTYIVRQSPSDSQVALPGHQNPTLHDCIPKTVVHPHPPVPTNFSNFHITILRLLVIIFKVNSIEGVDNGRSWVPRRVWESVASKARHGRRPERPRDRSGEHVRSIATSLAAHPRRRRAATLRSIPSSSLPSPLPSRARYFEPRLSSSRPLLRP